MLMIKNKVFKFLSVFLLLIVCFTSFAVPNANAATKYNYIANGEKNILGFKISNIVQIEDCSSIDITMTSSKNIVEFSNYQTVKYNGVEYSSGNHAIDNTKNATFTFEDVTAGTIISPIIIYVEKIENTSCPLVISHKKGDTVIEEVKLTLSATFYSDEPSDIVNNKENTSGSLTQEDVIINRPKEEEKPVEKPTEKPTEKPVEKPNDTTQNENQTQNPNEDNPQQPNGSQNQNQNQNQNGNENGNDIQQPNVEDEPQYDSEIELPIINETATAEKEQAQNNQNTEKPIDTETKPENPDDENKSFMDIINNIDKKIIIIAIIGVSVLLIIVVVLIVVFSKSNKKKEETEEIPPLPVVEEQSLMPQETTQENPFVVQELDESEENLLQPEEPLQDEFSPVPVFEETVNAEKEAPIEETPVVDEAPEELKSVEPVIEIIDEYETILSSTIPKDELEKLKNDFSDLSSIADLENEYSDIVK